MPGKSTLLRALTRTEVHVADQMFAPLDPTSRRLRFPREREVTITDTVGFVPGFIPAFNPARPSEGGRWYRGTTETGVRLRPMSPPSGSLAG